MSSLPQRASVGTLIAEAVLGGARLAPACELLGFSERTFQRWQLGAADSPDGRTLRHEAPAHKFSVLERANLLAVANSAEFGHLAPSQIVPRLADQQRYIGSESTFYRVLREENQLSHRRAERAPQKRSKPRAVAATEPDQLFSWDITYLPTTVHGIYLYLYLFVDVFSRKIVAWQIYAEENGENASEVMKDLCRRENIKPGQLILHSDNGGSMKGATMLATLQKLGVMASLSRPAVSNDNPYSESLFRTLKYRPAYPLNAFINIAAARIWATTLIEWYNHEHRHSAIRFVTPAQRHGGLDTAILQRRSALYAAARAKNPRRWTGTARNWRRIDVVHLNPEKIEREGESKITTGNKLKMAA
jgi:transposase InsO family protein